MISIPFAGVGGGNVPVSAIQVKNFAATDYNQENDYDWIMIWDNETCAPKNFFYCVEDNLGWVDDGFAPMEESYPEGLHAGQCFWYLANSGADREGPLSITIAGQVEGKNDVTFDLVSKTAAIENYSMLANPYPVAWSPNNAEQCVIANFGATDYNQENDYDWIMVWDNKICAPKNFFYCEEDNLGWVDDGFAPLEETFENGIPAGNAFWYLANSGVERAGKLSITFFNPLKK